MEEIGAESRRRIMDAAEALFAEKGFSRTSFVDVAERSGISRGSIPWHFENKDGLLIAVVERAIDRFMPAGSISSSGAEGVQEVFQRVKEWMHGPTAAMLYMILTEALSSDGPVHDHYVEFFRNRRTAAALLLASTGESQDQPSEGHRADLDRITAVVNGAIFGLGLQHQLDPTFDLDGSMDVLEALTEAAISGEPKKARSSPRKPVGRQGIKARKTPEIGGPVRGRPAGPAGARGPVCTSEAASSSYAGVEGGRPPPGEESRPAASPPSATSTWPVT